MSPYFTVKGGEGEPLRVLTRESYRERTFLPYRESSRVTLLRNRGHYRLKLAQRVKIEDEGMKHWDASDSDVVVVVRKLRRHSGRPTALASGD